MNNKQQMSKAELLRERMKKAKSFEEAMMIADEATSMGWNLKEDNEDNEEE